ncbi:hypothetical protein BH11MYX4_BH11MYX4_29140 [soil metagenome]
MRMTAALKVLSLLAGSCVGCAEIPESNQHRQNLPVSVPAGDASELPGEGSAAPITVTGHLSSEGSGSVEQGLGGSKLLAVARSVEVFALGSNGELVPVSQTDVKPGGAFKAIVPKNASATGILVVRVKDLLGAVVGSGIVNGLPAFLDAFLIDATIDTATSFKTEILVTLAKKGVPGVQNYLNVIDAYVDAQLANSIAVVGVLSTDLTTLIGATSDAIIAVGDVIVEALKKAGIPVDLSALQKAQASAVSGLQGLVTNSTGSLVATSKNLVAALQAATAKAAAPIDQAIFNAIVNGGATFSAAFKKGVPTKTLAGGAGKPDLGFVVSKSVFSLETALTTASVTEGFKQNGVATGILDAVTTGCGKFNSAVANASSLGELEAARTAFTNVLLGGAHDDGLLALLAHAFADLSAVLRGVELTLAPHAKTLTAAFATRDQNAIGDALASFDAGTKTELPAKLKAAVSDKDASAIASALRLVQKQVVQ